MTDSQIKLFCAWLDVLKTQDLSCQDKLGRIRIALKTLTEGFGL